MTSHQSTEAEPGKAVQTESMDNAPVTRRTRAVGIWPGILICILAAGCAFALSLVLPGMSALLLAILLGAVWRNVLPVHSILEKGVAWSAKKLLRVGIVLLGLQLSLTDIIGLGAGALVVVVLSVLVTFLLTLWFGKMLGIGLAQRLLIASGFSICGAAAVAATESASNPRKEEVLTAIGLVVLFGTMMIPLVPFLGSILGLPEESVGMWIGASTHEVAQVVAAGGAVGSSALTIAVTVKLARVLMLAPIVSGISWHQRRKNSSSDGDCPPIVPLFVIGFTLMMLLRTTEVVPEQALEIARILQTGMLASAMFALGLGINIRALARVGGRPVVLALVATVVILSVSLLGTLLFPPTA